MLLPQIYLAYYERPVRIICLDHTVVVTPNTCHVRACSFVHDTGVQVSKKQNVSSLPNFEFQYLVLWELP